MEKIKTGLTFIIVLIYFPLGLNAQLTATGDLSVLIDELVDDMPGNGDNNYALPNASEIMDWEEMLNQLWEEDLVAAAQLAETLSYDLTIFEDTPTNKTYWVLTNNSNHFWGSYVINPNYCRSLVIQAPHPRRDLNTGREALHVFRSSESAVFMMAGTHRCNVETSSSCSGTTQVCSSGNSQAYPISDLAHHTENIFQSTTEFLFHQIESSYFLSLHGFTQGANDPYLIMSNGTRQTPNPDYIAQLADALTAEDAVLTTEAAHLNLDWTRLIGFTNVQGRLINNSISPCDENAIETQGRFLHIEQEKTRLRDNLAGWNKMANAVAATFPCTPVATEEVTPSKHFHIAPNPVNNQLSIRFDDVSLSSSSPLLLINSLGQNLTSYAPPRQISTNEWVLDCQELQEGLYFLKIGTTIAPVIVQH